MLIEPCPNAVEPDTKSVEATPMLLRPNPDSVETCQKWAEINRTLVEGSPVLVYNSPRCCRKTRCPPHLDARGGAGAPYMAEISWDVGQTQAGGGDIC